MTHPKVMIRRAQAIMDACGGTPDRMTLVNATPSVQCAWLAYHVEWNLMFARDWLHFLHLARGRGVDSLAWHYRAYRRKRLAAHNAIRSAGHYLRQAENAYAVLERVEA